MAGRRRSTSRPRRARRRSSSTARGSRSQAVTDAGGRAAAATRSAPATRRAAGRSPSGSARRGGSRSATAAAPDAAALQWLTPRRPPARRHPYLFSQGQAILNRTWIPTQDSPGIRQTWEARITAPEPLKVVMSGERLTPDGEPAGAGRRAFRFRMTHPVAPYLIAIAAGDIAFRELGPRTGVWTEPAMLDARRGRARRHREDGRGGRAALRPLSLGPLRRDRAAAELPLRRHGESDPHLPDADLHRRRPEPGRPGRARAGAQLVGQSRHQRDLAGRLAQRGLHLLFREPDHGGALRPRRARAQEAALSWADMESALRRARPRRARHPAPRRRRAGRRQPAASSTTRARSSCARSSGSSGASAATPICAPISTATPSSR